MQFDRYHVSIWLKILGIVGIPFGLSLALPGIYLITLGGSWYYAIAGIATALAGWLILRGDVRGVLLYLIVFTLTALWALMEVWGMDQWFWPLIPRLFAFAFALFFILLAVPLFPSVRGKTGQVRAARLGALLVLIGLGLIVYGMFLPHGVVRNDFAAAASARQMPPTAEMAGEWRNYSGSTLGNRFQPADQINRDTVKNLKVA